MDINKLCRSCMKEVASWEKENFDKNAVDMFCYCTNIKIIEEDKLPKQFCYECIIKIESSYTFIGEARKVDATLKNIISRTETSVIVEPENQTKSITYDEVIQIPKLSLPDQNQCMSNNFDDDTLFDDEYYKQDGYFSKNFKPEIDDIEFKYNETEKVHIKDTNNQTEENREPKKNVCPVCRKGFTSKTWFAKHMQKEHTGHEYTGAHSSKTFSKPSQLPSHAAPHPEERKFACSACGKRFKRRKQLARHTRAHGDARPYACDKCTMRFKTKSVLKCHMKVHEDSKQYLCYFCGWSFAQAGNLEVHMRVHTGEKPFSCKECDFRASVASNLRRHERRHRGARCYVCTQCGKGFYDASGLARHVRTHTGELPYKCPSCARAFADSWKRKTHLIRAHRLQLHDIPRMKRDGETLQ